MLRAIFILLLALSLPMLLEAKEQTYGTLAHTTCPPLYKELEKSIPVFDHHITPSDPKVAYARKTLLSLRNCLDLFAFAYPDHKDQLLSPLTDDQTTEDLLIDIRDDLNVGYTLIGDFRDLSFVAHPKKNVVDDRRQRVLDWFGEWKKHDLKEGYDEYISSPNENKFTHRSAHRLSSFFWGAVDVEPSHDRDGKENVEYLVKALLKLLNHRFQTVWDLTKSQAPIRNKDELLIHDYRKLSRAVLSINEMIPVFPSSPNGKNRMNVLEQLYDVIGKLEDSRADYDYQLEHGTKKNIENSKKQLEKVTASVHHWLKISHLLPAIRWLEDHLEK